MEPTFGHTIIPSEPRVGDTVEFIDRSNAANVIMVIDIDSSYSMSEVNFTQDGSMGQLVYNSAYPKSRLVWDYPLIDGYYNFDTTKRFRTKFIINRKVSKLILFRIGTNFYTSCDGLMRHNNARIEVIKRDTIYIK
ncbi:MAG: hypothetical protein JNL32_14690 [Candidatus Kapabacteria bacterium]|nr:hypothetical protein [Candidatus Kapabacteria bacterium]